MKRIAALLLLCLAGVCPAAPQDAVVHIPSHGGSGTVIHTESGRSFVLTAGHCFKGRKRHEPVVIEAPSPAPGSPQRRGIRVVRVDYPNDLTLLEVGAGPLPYVCPVAPPGHRQPQQFLSVGYDRGESPVTVRRATLLRVDGNVTWTQEPPVPGRSGGALIDQETGELVGVVMAYSHPKWRPDIPQHGLYVSHDTVCRFLLACGWRSAGQQTDPFAVAAPHVEEHRDYGRPPAARPFLVDPFAAPGCRPGGT